MEGWISTWPESLMGLASGLEVARVEIRKDELVIFTGKPVEAVDEQDAANEWDEVLTNAPDKKRSA